jgi:hypothetical protein
MGLSQYVIVGMVFQQPMIEGLVLQQATFIVMDIRQVMFADLALQFS